MKITYLILLLLLIISCSGPDFNGKTNNSKEEIIYYYENYRNNTSCIDTVFNNDECIETSLTFDTIDLVVENNDSLLIIKEFHLSRKYYDTIVYKINKNNNDLEFIIKGEADKSEVMFVNSITLKIGQNNHIIYRYAFNPYTADGCATGFFSQEFGQIMVRSTAWNNYGILRSNNDSINNILERLRNVLSYDWDNFYGCFKGRMISEEEYQEFLESKVVRKD